MQMNNTALNAQLVDLAERVIEVTPTFVMVDKQQTAQQRRAHEPITQAKRWGATVKIAGMTSMEFGEMFDVLHDIKHLAFDGSTGGSYTRAKAIQSVKDEAAQEFFRVMSLIARECERWGGNNFSQAIEHLNNYTTKEGN
jgi:hypothetical protein